MLNFNIISKYWLQIVEIDKPNIIFRYIDKLQSFCTCKSNRKMLKAQAVIELLLKTKIFQFSLIFHFNFNLFSIINIFESNIVPKKNLKLKNKLTWRD